MLGWFDSSAPDLYARASRVSAGRARGGFYGFPIWGIPGRSWGGTTTATSAVPDSLNRTCDAADEAARRGGLRYMPQANGALLSSKACMFTNTADEHFVLDTLPQHPQVVVASPCSGHGFKFCSVVGEIVADLATGGGQTRHDISLHRLQRLLKDAPVA